MNAPTQLKSQTNIVEIIGRYLDLTKQGNCFSALCPFHNEKTASFKVFPSTQRFKCFGCGESGDVFSFIMKIEQCTFPEALTRLDDKTIRRVIKKPASQPTQPTLSLTQRSAIYQAFLDLTQEVFSGKSNDSSEGARWLNTHKHISWGTLCKEQLDIRWLADYRHADQSLRLQFPLAQLQAAGLYSAKGHLRFFKHRLIFPFMLPSSQGKYGYMPYYVQARDITAQHKNQRFLNAGEIPAALPAYYNPTALITARQQRKPLFICEGITDTLTLFQHGCCAVGIIGNQGFKPLMAHWLTGLTVFLALDQDRPEATHKVVKILIEQGHPPPYVLPLPKDQDITELFSRFRSH